MHGATIKMVYLCVPNNSHSSQPLLFLHSVG